MPRIDEARSHSLIAVGVTSEAPDGCCSDESVVAVAAEVVLKENAKSLISFLVTNLCVSIGTLLGVTLELVSSGWVAGGVCS